MKNKKYNTFIYDHFEIEYLEDLVKLRFYYEIVGLKKFIHKIEIPCLNKNIKKDDVDTLAFNIGLIEAINYYKATIAENFKVNCGILDDEQKDFFKKLYYYGLGEFFYTNNIDVDKDTFINFDCKKKTYNKIEGFNGNGSLIAIGGGKDSCVTLSLIPRENTNCFIINPKSVMLDCANVAGYTDDEIVAVQRTLDYGIIELNNEGFLNGHIPFSAMVAFVSFLSAYLNGKKEIILSNEASANEANVNGTKINHQYSKSYEFESDFQTYAKKYLSEDIKYFSLLRPLLEYQVGLIFSKCDKFHQIFKSCNVGSKEIPWKWCSKCSKCLFVYSLLSPFLYKDKLINIFGKDMFLDKELLTTFKELLGKENVKPFDCVGTFDEMNYAITKTIKNIDGEELPYLLKYYKDNYYDEEILKLDLEHHFNEKHSLSSKYESIIREALK